MKALTAATRLGPAAVFLPDGTSAVMPAHERITGPLVAQVQARGGSSSFEQHAARLAAGPPYAGRWSVEDVPDGITAAQVLHLVRYRAAQEIFTYQG